MKEFVILGKRMLTSIKDTVFKLQELLPGAHVIDTNLQV